jgi:arylsulfatase A-like enzyme
MNVLVLMLDTLRPDHLGCYGNTEVRTTHLDRLAAEGVRARTAYAEFPNTIPARTAFVSGSYTFPDRPWQALEPADTHVAELFRASGYHTVAFSDTPFNNGANMDRGFEEFNHFKMGKCLPPADGRPFVDYSDAYMAPGYPEKEVLYWAKTKTNIAICREQFGCTPGERFFGLVCEWLRGAQDRPFFLWVDSFQPHEPWDAGEPYRSMYAPRTGYQGRYLPMPMAPDADKWMMPGDLEHLRALYKASATESDDLVGQVLQTLAETGLAQDTLVLALSDHGMPLGEHHGLVRKFDYPLYDELSRIAWIMRAPGRLPAGAALDGLVSNVDFLPTVLDLCDLPAPEGCEGLDLVPYADGSAPVPRDMLFMGAYNYRTAVRTDRYKFTDNRGEQPNELYDMLQDPGETENLLPRMPELGARLHRAIWDFHEPWKVKHSRHHQG